MKELTIEDFLGKGLYSTLQLSVNERLCLYFIYKDSMFVWGKNKDILNKLPVDEFINCTQISKKTGLSKSTVSRCVEVLEALGLISAEYYGRDKYLAYI